jgi:extradiol dioxygenase family protein
MEEETKSEKPVSRTAVPQTAYEIVVSMDPVNALIRQIDQPDLAYDHMSHKS